MRDKRQSVNAGFTLIEFMALFVIIGILAIIALPRFVDFKGASQSIAFYAIKQSLEAEAAIKRTACARRGKAIYPPSASVLIDGSGIPGDCMERAMPRPGFAVTAQSGAVIIADIEGKTISLIYEPATGKVIGEYK